jgi:DNA-binding CsgD family transcriptional regulator
VSEGLRWLWLASIISVDVWDDRCWRVLSARHVALARDAGALTELLLALNSRVMAQVFAGELTEAASLVDEADAVREVTGSGLAPCGAMALAAWRGREEHARTLIEASMSDAVDRGEGVAVTIGHWTSALLFNGLGRYEDALVAARQAGMFPAELCAANWGLAELVESAARTGATSEAAHALEQLTAMTGASGGDWALGVESRSRALLSEGDTAERLYRDAIEHLRRTRVHAELARARLLYGEWLRREGRRLDAREQLRTAHDLFSTMGAEGFAERARRELLATGETARKRTIETHDELTPQEAQIARLAAHKHTNSEIGAQLFISPRTVEWHLRKVFTKLGVSSRKELSAALPDPVRTGP